MEPSPDFRGVYFIYADNGLTKIGRTTHLPSRYYSLKSCSPCDLNVLAFLKCDNIYGMEREFHEMFHDKRVRGEWFDLREEDIAMLIDRQPILDDTVELMAVNDKYHLGLSVSESIYKKHCA